MMNFRWEESYRYNPWKQKGQSTLFSPTCTAIYEPLKRETMFPPVSKVNLTHFVGHELPIECPTTLDKLQQRPLDLQLSADEFIYHVEKRSRIENGWNFAEAPKSFFLSGVSSSNAEDPKLSLSIGGNNRRNFLANSHKLIDLEEGTGLNFLRKKAFSSSHEVIDLEKPDDKMTSFANSGPSLSSLSVKVCPEAKHELQGFSLKEPFNPYSLKKIPHLDIVESNSFQEHSECCQEPGSSSKGFRDCGDGIPCDDLRSKIQQFVSSQSKDLFDLNKALQDDSCCCSEDHTDLNASQQDKTVNVALLDLNKNYTDEDIRASNLEDNRAWGSVVTLASPSILQKGNRSGPILESNSDNDSSSGKTQHSVITSDVSDQCLQSQVAENNSRHKPSEIDISVQEAAASLIHMSDSNTKLEKSEKPENSLDSFELNTLNLTETNLDDDSASSKPVFMNIADGIDFGVKLRRGRRMKDFQKEILPSLASLSRHEILEDVNIMEGALRSREYRKNRGKMPQRSRRPRRY